MRCLLHFLIVAAAAAQSQPGIAPAWDVRAALKALAQNSKQYKETVEKLRVADWVSQGAPDAYRHQQQIVVTEAGYLAQSSARLAEDPERLSLLVDVLFRLEAIEEMTASLSQGTNRYQDADTSRALGRLLNENGATRLKLRQYLIDLTQIKEQE